MVIAYHAVYKDDDYKTKSIEEPFDLPVYDMDTSKPTDYRYCGIMDCLLEKKGKLYAGDHKTTSRISSTYWDDLKTNPQLTHYLLAMRQLGIDVQGFVWDVLLKPSLTPFTKKKLTKKSLDELNTGYYYGLPYDYQGEEYENPRMFGIRCLATILDNPMKYFERRLLRRSDKELIEYNRELLHILREQDEVKEDVSKQYRNLKACNKYNSMCEYHELCAGQEDLNHTHLYKVKEDVKEEDRKTPSGSVSTSRIECYLTCRKKWMYKYNYKLEKNISIYRDSLEIGSMVHEALEIILAGRMSDTPISFSQTHDESKQEVTNV